MIYRIGTEKLDIPETGPNRKARTPRQVVPWRDVAETCRTLDAVLGEIPEGSWNVVDGIARAGFWGAVFRNRWPSCSLVLNEEDGSCSSILRENFPNDRVSSRAIEKWAPKRCDVALLDFDHFTLRILDRWKDVLSLWSPRCRYFIIADGACFGFKFGNLRHYDCSSPEEYYRKLDSALREFLDKRITVVSSFMNASTILLEKKKGKRIKFLPPSDLELSRGGRPYGKKKRVSKGFGL